MISIAMPASYCKQLVKAPIDGGQDFRAGRVNRKYGDSPRRGGADPKTIPGNLFSPGY
jgi:hypothetical protein